MRFGVVLLFIFLLVQMTTSITFDPFGIIKRRGNNDRTTESIVERELARYRQERDELENGKSRAQIISSIIDFASSLGSALVYAVLARALINNLREGVGSMLKTVNGTTSGSSLPESVTKFLPNVTLTSFEMEIAATIVDPAQIETDFRDIGGLKEVKRSLIDCISVDMNNNRHNAATTAKATAIGDVDTSSSLLKPVQGVLLFGPAGCGKSALVRAMAKRAGLPLIPLTPSSLLRKWVGDTSQLTKALFSVAVKLQPCILFIDEMDSLFRARHEDDNAVDRNIKTEFMQLWDALARSDARVIVVGATNRPQDLDQAIQRRFERSFLVGPPNEAARVEVFKAVLRSTSKEQGFDYEKCARMTEGYTPSDILSLCKAAAHIPLREYRRNNKKASASSPPSSTSTSTSTAEATAGLKSSRLSPRTSLRPLRISDIEEAKECVYPTAWASSSYGAVAKQSEQQQHFNSNNNPYYTPSPPSSQDTSWGAGGGGDWSGSSFNYQENDDEEDDD